MQPTVGDPFAVGTDTHVIPTYWPVPGAGVLPMNAFVVGAEEPVLVDTGIGVLGDDFMAALSSVVDPARLRWIWLTHEDRDHTGSLMRLLDLAPRATVVSSFLAIGRLMPETPFPLERLRVVNPGDVVNAGDRNLLALRPPVFDSPGTVGFLDDRSGMVFSSDCFGAPLPTAEEAAASTVDDVDEGVLEAAQLAWATVDSPWVTLADEAALARSLDGVRRLRPRALLSSHLPPVHRAVDRVLTNLQGAPSADPVPGTTHAELRALLDQLDPGRHLASGPHQTEEIA
ncbi:MAG TPA: MBL fold metallo-hydrolase [Jiangellales bacterium]|nr:MBL fold metallo-hydrolase [Jiangellales bacterium]